MPGHQGPNEFWCQCGWDVSSGWAKSWLNIHRRPQNTDNRDANQPRVRQRRLWVLRARHQREVMEQPNGRCPALHPDRRQLPGMLPTAPFTWQCSPCVSWATWRATSRRNMRASTSCVLCGSASKQPRAKSFIEISWETNLSFDNGKVNVTTTADYDSCLIESDAKGKGDGWKVLSTTILVVVPTETASGAKYWGLLFHLCILSEVWLLNFLRLSREY